MAVKTGSNQSVLLDANVNVIQIQRLCCYASIAEMRLLELEILQQLHVLQRYVH